MCAICVVSGLLPEARDNSGDESCTRLPTGSPGPSIFSSSGLSASRISPRTAPAPEAGWGLQVSDPNFEHSTCEIGAGEWPAPPPQMAIATGNPFSGMCDSRSIRVPWVRTTTVCRSPTAMIISLPTFLAPFLRPLPTRSRTCAPLAVPFFRYRTECILNQWRHYRE